MKSSPKTPLWHFGWEGLFHLKFVVRQFGKFYLLKIFRESFGKMREMTFLDMKEESYESYETSSVLNSSCLPWIFIKCCCEFQ